jgi:predicted membrane protein
MTDNAGNGIRGRVIAGLIIIFLGLLFLLGNLYPKFNAALFLGKLWPLILIIIGLIIIFNQAHVRKNVPFDATSQSRIIGDIRLEFANKDVGDSSISQVVGDLTLDLSNGRLKPGINHMNVSMVIGDTLILIPSSMPLRVSARTFLGDIILNGRREEGMLPRLEHVDETYESSSNKLYITLSGIIGDITFQRI